MRHLASEMEDFQDHFCEAMAHADKLNDPQFAHDQTLRLILHSKVQEMWDSQEEVVNRMILVMSSMRISGNRIPGLLSKRSSLFEVVNPVSISSFMP